jgi:transcriptional regulator with XRE-family HTH domain
MDIKSLKNIFRSRIIELHRSLNYSTKKMGECLRASSTSYLRYEQGKTLPGFSSLYSIAEKLGISLDWLVCGKGPVYYKEKEKTDQAEERVEEKAAEREEIKKDILQRLLPGFSQEDINDFLELMSRIPLLRHEVLVFFYKFKAENKDLVAEVMTKQD